MTDATIVVVDEEMIDPVTGGIIVQKEVAQRLFAQAKGQGMGSTGPGGSLNQPTGNVVETTESAGLIEYLSHERSGTLNGQGHA